MGDLKNIKLSDLDLDIKDLSDEELIDINGGGATGAISDTGVITASKLTPGTVAVYTVCYVWDNNVFTITAGPSCATKCPPVKQTHYTVCRSMGPCWS